MTIKFYYNLLSQPSRALYLLFKLNNFPFESCLVDLNGGEHLTDEFKEKYSRFQKVPFIHDGDFKLTENVAIARYVATQYRDKIADYWYPRDSRQQARVDEYLEWQHNNTRQSCALYVWTTLFLPRITGIPADSAKVERFKSNMITCLDQMEDLWFSQGCEYIAGNKISYADILAACELEQPSLVGFDVTTGRPNMTEWMKRVQKETAPYYEEAHAAVRKVAARNAFVDSKL